MLQAYGDYPDIDLLTTHPMFRVGGLDDDNRDNGETSSPFAASWDNRPGIYAKVRISNLGRLESFLKIFEEARCRLVEMSSEQHDTSSVLEFRVPYNLLCQLYHSHHVECSTARR